MRKEIVRPLILAIILVISFSLFGCAVAVRDPYYPYPDVYAYPYYPSYPYYPYYYHPHYWEHEHHWEHEHGEHRG